MAMSVHVVSRYIIRLPLNKILFVILFILLGLKDDSWTQVEDA